MTDRQTNRQTDKQIARLTTMEVTPFGAHRKYILPSSSLPVCLAESNTAGLHAPVVRASLVSVPYTSHLASPTPRSMLDRQRVTLDLEGQVKFGHCFESIGRHAVIAPPPYLAQTSPSLAVILHGFLPTISPHASQRSVSDDSSATIGQ